MINKIINVGYDKRVPFGYLLKNYFRKVLKLFLWEIKKKSYNKRGHKFGCSLRLQLPLKILTLLYILKIKLLDCMLYYAFNIHIKFCAN